MASATVRVLARGSYYVHPQEVGRLINTVGTAANSEHWTPAVLLSVQDSGFASEHAQMALDDFVRRDDVFCDDFTSAVILQPSPGVDIAPALAHDSLAQGPYFIHGKSIHQAWKLYEDELGAFVVPVMADDVVNPTRAYNELYPPRTSSADYVTKLTQLGAIIVGKTKMSAFASAEEPTDQWVDYHCPFNPRGDTYQTPSCSSTGAASGSIRLPAAFNGLFGLRTSYGIASRQGIVPSCK
ncbi:amidase signature domain-containing protein [Dichotomopilus funicola]|uniref:Amidase signature domain-containing protein n=1 Tax=Dichotomopilus funicola TaxID=1934379 RepID=A0AAN6ZM84_9PEZI|nr:amidase signature domain-containing protein [Dichotomopilus funicola]